MNSYEKYQIDGIEGSTQQLLLMLLPRANGSMKVCVLLCVLQRTSVTLKYGDSRSLYKRMLLCAVCQNLNFVCFLCVFVGVFFGLFLIHFLQCLICFLQLFSSSESDKYKKTFIKVSFMIYIITNKSYCKPYLFSILFHQSVGC